MSSAKSAPRILPAAATQAAGFEKARHAQSTALLEDYAELIDDLTATGAPARPTDIARRLGVSHATAIKNIARLEREGLAQSQRYHGVRLTEAGGKLAQSARARHAIVLEVLLALGAPRAAAERDAEGIEHHVSAETLKAFQQFLKARRGAD